MERFYPREEAAQGRVPALNLENQTEFRLVHSALDAFTPPELMGVREQLFRRPECLSSDTRLASSLVSVARAGQEGLHFAMHNEPELPDNLRRRRDPDPSGFSFSGQNTVDFFQMICLTAIQPEIEAQSTLPLNRTEEAVNEIIVQARFLTELVLTSLTEPEIETLTRRDNIVRNSLYTRYQEKREAYQASVATYMPRFEQDLRTEFAGIEGEAEPNNLQQKIADQALEGYKERHPQLPWSE